MHSKGLITDRSSRAAIALLLGASLALAASSAAAEEAKAPPAREWTALGAGAAIPLKGGSSGLALSEELGRHWVADNGDSGFATGALLGQNFYFGSGATLTELKFQFRALYDIPIAVGTSTLTVGPAFAGGVDVVLGGPKTDVAPIITPHVDIRLLLGEQRGFFVFARPAVPIRFGSNGTTTALEAVGGAGVRFAVF